MLAELYPLQCDDTTLNFAFRERSYRLCPQCAHTPLNMSTETNNPIVPWNFSALFINTLEVGSVAEGVARAYILEILTTTNQVNDI